MDEATELEAGRSCGQFVTWSNNSSINFWTEAKRASRRITSKRLKSAPHNDAAQTIARSVLSKMSPEHSNVIVEIDRMMTVRGEIGIPELRETLGRVLEDVDVNVTELRAVHNSPVEALTYLLNHIIAIHNNRKEVELKASAFVPVSKRIEQLLKKAKELGLDNIEVPSNKIRSEREKLAMIEKQIAGKLKLNNAKTNKFDKNRYLSKFKTEELKKRRGKVVANREKLRQKLFTKGSRSKVIANYNIIETSPKWSTSKKLLEGPESTISTAQPSPSERSTTSSTQVGTSKETASIDTSSWVISPTHKYYFGCSPPPTPKPSVTHEVYTKPVEMIETVVVDDDDMETRATIVTSGSSLEMSVDGAAKTSTTFVRSLDDLSHFGDGTTIFDWTEPEKSLSFCCLSSENVADDDGATEAAGDGSDLARIKGEMSMSTLEHEALQDNVQVIPPIPFYMAALINESTSDTIESYVNYNENVRAGNRLSEYDEKVDLEPEALEVAVHHRDSCSDSSMKEQVCDVLNEYSEHELEGYDYETFNSSQSSFDEPPALSNESIVMLPVESFDFQSEDSINNGAFGDQELHKIVTPWTIQEYQEDVRERFDVTKPGTGNSKLILQELQAEIMKRNNQLNQQVVESQDEAESPPADEANLPKQSKPELNTADGNLALDVIDELKADSQPVQDDTTTKGAEVLEISLKADMETLMDEHNINPAFVPSDDAFTRRCFREATPKKSVDNFKSADDITRPVTASDLPGDQSSKEIKTRLYDSLITSSSNCKETAKKREKDTRARQPIKRNDMLTLTFVAIALGLGTLGYMTSAGGGSTQIFADLVAPTGGKVLNMIERALEVLRALPNRD